MNQPMDKIIVPLTKWLLLLFMLNSCYSNRGITQASANQIQITHIVSSEESEPIILDCDYEAEETNSSLVVKWLKDEKPIYQWIKGRKPTVYPPSKGLIDEEYEKSTNPNYKHRAILFPVPTKELSGTYTCLVETMNSTQMIQTHLQVIDVSQSSIELHYVTLSNDTLVTCAVENVYPQPTLLVWSNEDISLFKISEKVNSENDGFFNATVVVSANEINNEDEIGCTLNFPGAEFNLTKILKSSASIIKTTTIALMMLMLAISV